MATHIEIIKDNIPQVIAAILAGRDELGKGVADAIEKYAKDFVPVLTGALKISIRSSGGGGTYEITADSMEGGAPRSYAGYVEYGTSKMAPQPYMTPAYEAGKATALPVEEAKFIAKIEAAAG